MRNKHWIKFWKDYGQKKTDLDCQTQVLRTFNQSPIDGQLWEETLKIVLSYLDITSRDTVIDLCGGNGLISREIAKTCKSLTTIDISKDLLKNFDTSKLPNVNKIAKDIRKVKFPNNSYDKVLIYAGLQYLTLREVIEIFDSIYNWLRDEGIFYIGDIPDNEKKWVFFNNKERETTYFNTIKNQKPTIGTWFEKEWLIKLAHYSGFSSVDIIPQTQKMIYSTFRFDMLIKK